MFTGIIIHTPRIQTSKKIKNSLVLSIEKPKGIRLAKGNSLCIDGVCLTVASTTASTLLVELTPETLVRSTFGHMIPERVNLELPLRLTDRLDGHLVQGHVDATAVINKVQKNGNSYTFTITLPRRYQKLVVEKGSIAVDGISFTVVSTGKGTFSVALVPYTIKHTTLKRKNVGDLVNLEFDIIGKYVQKALNSKYSYEKN